MSSAVDSALKAGAQILLCQIDPLRYIMDTRKIVESKEQSDNQHEHASDPKALERNLKIIEKRLFKRFYPFGIEEALFDISVVEILHNSEKEIKQSKINKGFFNAEMFELINSLHSQSLTDAQRGRLDQKLAVLKPLIEYAEKYSKYKLNPSPFDGMEGVAQNGLNKISDLAY